MCGGITNPPQPKEPEGPFGDIGHGLLLPKIMELDILQERQTDALLGKTTHWLVITILVCNKLFVCTSLCKQEQITQVASFTSPSNTVLPVILVPEKIIPTSYGA